MPKTNKISLFLVLCLISVSVLTGCQNNNFDEQTNNNGNLESAFEPSTVNTQLQKTTLTLNHHGCIGCGICTQIAPDNFTMQGRKATVISQKNITNQKVSNAIKNCPVSVIEIVEA